MNYRDKLDVIDAVAQDLLNGQSYPDAEATVDNNGDLTRREADDVLRKAMQKVDDVHAQRVYDQLLRGEESTAEQLHLTVHGRVKEFQERRVRGELKKQITEALLLGEELDHDDPRIVHPVMSELDVRNAINAARDRHEYEELAQQRNQTPLYLGIVFLVGGIVATMVVDGYLFYGAMIVGVINLFRYFAQDTRA